jgi:two-component system response regulator NreC
MLTSSMAEQSSRPSLLSTRGQHVKGSATLTIRVFIADDHGVLRTSLRDFLDAQPDMGVVGEAANGPDALVGIKNTEPDIVLMDISMPDGGGLAAIAAAKRDCPNTRFLVLTAHEEVGYVRAAIDGGAEGFVAKTAAASELLGAIRAVARGRTFIDSSIALEQALRPSQSSRGGASRARNGATQLTGREREVLERVAEGYTNGQIATQLQLGIKSVETYRSRVMEKLDLESRADLVRFALESGILSPGKPLR